MAVPHKRWKRLGIRKMYPERRKEMITLHEAIRSIQGIPQLFVTDKLTIELSCVFSETDSTDTKGSMSALSVLTLDTASKNSVSSEKVQKVILEFRTEDSKNTQGFEHPQSTDDPDDRSIPFHADDGKYPYGE